MSAIPIVHHVSATCTPASGPAGSITCVGGSPQLTSSGGATITCTGHTRTVMANGHTVTQPNSC